MIFRGILNVRETISSTPNPSNAVIRQHRRFTKYFSYTINLNGLGLKEVAANYDNAFGNRQLLNFNLSGYKSGSAPFSVSGDNRADLAEQSYICPSNPRSIYTLQFSMVGKYQYSATGFVLCRRDPVHRILMPALYRKLGSPGRLDFEIRGTYKKTTSNNQNRQQTLYLSQIIVKQFNYTTVPIVGSRIAKLWNGYYYIPNQHCSLHYISHQ